MKRILSLILTIIILLSLCSFPAKAEITLTSLRDVYKKLNQYCIKEYFGDSPKWDDFKNKSQQISLYLGSEEQNDSKTQKLYAEYKSEYIELMFSTFDYSQLQEGLHIYSKLDKMLFTEESWEEYRNAATEVYNEISSPSLFGATGKISKNNYIQSVQLKINEFSDALILAFNNLQLVEASEYSLSQLNAFYTVFDMYATNDSFSELDSFTNFSDAMEKAKSVMDDKKSTNKEINNSVQNLLKFYKKLINEAADFTAIENTIADFELMNEEEYLPSAYQTYKDEISKLQQKKNSIILFAFDTRLKSNDIVKLLNKYLSSITNAPKKMKDDLPTKKDKQALKALIDYYSQLPYSEEIKVYYDKLTQVIKNGEKILKLDTNTHSQYAKASNDITNVGEMYKTASESLNKREESIFASNMYMTRFLLYSIIAAFIISFFYARILSKIFFGKITWTK